MNRPARIAPIAMLAVVLIVQAVRMTHGLDFNDEMGYYGALVGLIAGGRLFSNDLFLQQDVYVLLWPLARPYVALFGMASLILLVRAIFAVFILWVFRRVRRSLETAGVSPAAAAVAALACTFVMPFLNIYSISYNSIGLGLLAVAFGEFYAWRCENRKIRTLWWAALLIMLLAVHPPLAVAIAAVLVARLWSDRDFPAMKRMALALCGFALLAGAALYPLAPTRRDLAAAIEFSRAMGVGTVFRTGLLWLLGIVTASVAVFAITERRTPAAVETLSAWRPMMPVAVGSLCVATVVLEWTGVMWLAAFISMFGGLAITAWPDPVQSERRRWLMILLLGTGTMMAVASSNGFRQFQGAAMLSAPMFFAIAVSAPATPAFSTRASAGWTFGAGLIATLFTCWLANPYHDARLVHQTTRVDGASAFRGLFLTPEKADAIRGIRAVLSDIPASSRVMVLGGQPWIYFATATHPDTDMVFMHSLLGLPRAFEILGERLALRHPDFVIVTGDVADPIRKAFDGLVREGRFICEDRPRSAALGDAKQRLQTFYPISPVISVCRPAPGR